MPSNRETGLLQKCGQVGCEWSVWLDSVKSDPHGVTELGHAAYLGHVAVEHRMLYPEVRELFQNTLAAEDGKREAAVREEAIAAQQRLARSAEAARIGVPIPNTMRRTEYNGPLRQGSQVGRNLYLTDVPGEDGFVAVTLGPTEYAFDVALWLVEAARRHHHAGHRIPIL